MHPPRRRPRRLYIMRVRCNSIMRVHTATPANGALYNNIIIMYYHRVNRDYNFFSTTTQVLFVIYYYIRVIQSFRVFTVNEFCGCRARISRIYINIHNRIIIKNAKNIIMFIPIGRCLRFNIIAELMQTTLKEQH